MFCNKHEVGFHLYETSRIDKETYQWLEGWKSGELLDKGMKFPFGVIKMFWKKKMMVRNIVIMLNAMELFKVVKC